MALFEIMSMNDEMDLIITRFHRGPPGRAASACGPTEAA